MPVPPRRAPHDLDAEKAVLGSILLDNSIAERVITKLRGTDFYDRKNGEIFRAIQDLFTRGEPIDAITLSNQLEGSKELDKSGGSEYIESLSESVPASGNAEFYGKIVRDHARMRRIIAAGEQLIEFGHDVGTPVEEVVSKAQEIVYGLGSVGSSSEFEKIGDYQIGSFFNRLENLSEHHGLAGLPSGIMELDRITSGFRPSNLIVIAGRPSMGKTALALNVAYHIGYHLNHAVGILSLEQSREELTDRMMSMASGIESEKLRKPYTLTETDHAKLAEIAGPLGEAEIWIDDSSFVNDLTLIAKARQLHSRTGCRILFVDYLQLMDGSRKHASANREQEVSAISRALKNVARELGIAIVACSQLSRAVEQRQDKHPMLSDLRESGSIEQDADQVIFIYRDDYYNVNSKKPNVAEIIVAKNRNGPIGTCDVYFDKPLTRFRDLLVEER